MPPAQLLLVTPVTRLDATGDPIGVHLVRVPAGLLPRLGKEEEVKDALC